MEIVIKIPDGMLETYKFWDEHGIATVEQTLIVHGTVLPKGHGDLIDKSKICKAIPAEEDNCTGIEMALDEMDAYNEGIDVMYSLVQGAKAIVEADKEK